MPLGLEIVRALVQLAPFGFESIHATARTLPLGLLLIDLPVAGFHLWL